MPGGAKARHGASQGIWTRAEGHSVQLGSSGRPEEYVALKVDWRRAGGAEQHGSEGRHRDHKQGNTHVQAGPVAKQV